jgi:hypothetical protein
MIASRHELLDAINRTVANATSDEKRALADVLLEKLSIKRCELCHEPKRTLLVSTETQIAFCFDCVGTKEAPPLIVREVRDLEILYADDLTGFYDVKMVIGFYSSERGKS